MKDGVHAPLHGLAVASLPGVKGRRSGTSGEEDGEGETVGGKAGAEVGDEEGEGEERVKGEGESLEDDVGAEGVGGGDAAEEEDGVGERGGSGVSCGLEEAGGGEGVVQEAGNEEVGVGLEEAAEGAAGEEGAERRVVQGDPLRGRGRRGRGEEIGVEAEDAAGAEGLTAHSWRRIARIRLASRP